MKKCQRCGELWDGVNQPSSRRVCEGCGAYLHTCVNCHHFDPKISNSCKLTTTFYVGPRDAPNYCEEFEMTNFQLKAAEDRTQSARTRWEELFKN